MGAMKTVAIRDPETSLIHVYAVNGEGEGFFHRAESENAWHQTQGTAQFRVKSLAEFLFELRRREVLTDLDQIERVMGWDNPVLLERTARAFGWYLARGNYTGTSDNRLDRWYWQRSSTDSLDFRGDGFRTKKEALEALL